MKTIVRMLVGAGVLFALPLLSCITLGSPSLPKPHGERDTLLIVPLERAADSQTGPYGNLRLSYRMQVSGASQSSEHDYFVTDSIARSTKLDARYPSFGIVRYLKPGRYTVEALRFISEKHGHRGKRRSLRNIEFTVQPNSISVLPYRFVVRYTRPKKEYIAEDSYIYIVDTDVTDIYKLNRSEIELLWQEIESYHNAEAWEQAGEP